MEAVFTKYICSVHVAYMYYTHPMKLRGGGVIHRNALSVENSLSQCAEAASDELNIYVAIIKRGATNLN